MSEHEQQTTIRNADLWASYFDQEWRRWADPLGLTRPANQIAQGTAARVANFLSLVASGPMAWLYNTSYEPVHQITGDETHADVQPAHFDAGVVEGHAA